MCVVWKKRGAVEKNKPPDFGSFGGNQVVKWMICYKTDNWIVSTYEYSGFSKSTKAGKS